MIDISSFLEDSKRSDKNDIPLLHNRGIDVYLRPPNASYWIVLIYAIIMIISCYALIGIIVYRNVIQRSKSQAAYILGYGIIIPFCIYIPFFMTNYFNIHNLHLRFTIVCAAVLSLFRTMEGIHGFPPNGSKVTLRSYLIYFCTLGEVEYNPETHQTKKPTLQDVVGNVSNLFFFLISISMYSSFLYHYDYALFETRVEINSLDHTVLDMLSYGHIINNFSLAVLLQGLLKFFSILTGLLANIVFRVEVKEGIKNAMFDAKSPSDFWGKKWNLIVHNLLKRAVYKPVREKYSVMAGVMCTFLASGLFHEWVLAVTFFIIDNDKDDDGHCSQCYYPETYGKHFMFFLWNGFVIGIEFIVLNHFPFFHSVGKTLPSILRTFMILMVSLPVAHWFFGDIAKAGFFHDCQIVFPTIVVKWP